MDEELRELQRQVQSNPSDVEALRRLGRLIDRQGGYQGRPVAAWVADLESSNTATNNAAEEAVRALGLGAVPALIEALGARGDGFYSHSGAIHHLEKLGPAIVPAVAQVLGSPCETTHKHAAQVLGNLGTAAAGALPRLIETLSDPRRGVRDDTCWALRELGEVAAPAIPALIEVWRRDLPSLPSPAGHAVELAQLDSDTEAALEALGGIGLPAVATLKTLEPALENWADEALLRISKNAAEALIDVSDDEDPREAVLQLMERIRPDPRLVEFLRSRRYVDDISEFDSSTPGLLGRGLAENPCEGWEPPESPGGLVYWSEGSVALPLVDFGHPRGRWLVDVEGTPTLYERSIEAAWMAYGYLDY